MITLVFCMQVATGLQLLILKRFSSGFQVLHIVWCFPLLTSSHSAVVQLNGERLMKPVLLVPP